MYQDLGRPSAPSLQRYPWVLPASRYVEDKNLTDFLSKAVIAPAEAKVKELKEKMKVGFV